MSDLEILQKNTDLFEKYGVSYAGLFGSRARGEHRENSDYDILVQMARPIGLFAFTGFEMELAGRLGKKVDLMTDRAVSPSIKESILRDLKIFYGERR